MSTSCYLCLSIKSPRPKRSLHKFPNDATTRKAWFKAVGLSEEVDEVSHTRICSLHFKMDDYVEPNAKLLGGRMVLKREAVPTVLVPNPPPAVVDEFIEDSSTWEIKDEIIEDSSICEMKDEFNEDSSIFEIKDEIIEDSSIYEIKDEFIEDSSIFEIKDEIFEDSSICEIKDEFIEDSSTWEIKDEIIEDSSICEMKDEFIEDSSTFEIEDEIIEDSSICEIKDEFIEDSSTWEIKDEIIEDSSICEIEDEFIEDSSTCQMKDIGLLETPAVTRSEIDMGTTEPVLEMLREVLVSNQEKDQSAGGVEIIHTPKKRKFAEPRYISEITTSDIATPRKAQRVLSLGRRCVADKNKKIKRLQDKQRYLLKRIASLKDSIKNLRSQGLITEEAGNTLMEVLT